MNITRGKLHGARKYVLYGVEGIGKSTFASKFPEPVFIDTEDSTKEMDVARFDKPTSWEMLLQEVLYVAEHPNVCKTLVIDTIDWAEKLCIKSVCARYQKPSIETFDYGKGYTFTYETFGSLLNLLGGITEKGISVLLTGHATTKRQDLPEEFGSYDRWGLNLIDSPKCSSAKMVREWADVLFFANYKTIVVAADDKGKKHKAQGGKRVVYTSHHPCWDAKNRLGLPEELPLDFDVIGPLLFPEAARSPVSPAREEKPLSPPPPAGSTPAPSSPPPAPPPDNAPSAAPAYTASDPVPASPPQSGTYAAMVDQTEGTYIPAKLRPLLDTAAITEEEVRRVIDKRQKKFFPLGTSWETMEKAGFVDGWVLPNWNKIVQMIQEDPERLPF